jgi:hypothetical protein
MNHNTISKVIRSIASIIIAFLILTISFYSNRQLEELKSLALRETNLATNPHPIDTGYIITAKAILASRFPSLDALESIVAINYSLDGKNGSTVKLSYHNEGFSILSVLKAGLSQNDFSGAKDSSLAVKIALVMKSPYAIRERENLENIYLLARRRPNFFGAGDVAFYDLAEHFCSNINTSEFAYLTYRDHSEKGYINTFNHINAQVIITVLYSEQIADFIGDIHELAYMPELTTGRFSDEQLSDTLNYPVDNYVDLINNEIGQELGKKLKLKYCISNNTKWTPRLLADFLNDIQTHYKWSFGIGFKPVHKDNEIIIKFSEKINRIKNSSFRSH